MGVVLIVIAFVTVVFYIVMRIPLLRVILVDAFMTFWFEGSFVGYRRVYFFSTVNAILLFNRSALMFASV